MFHPYEFAICGYSGSGKTYLIEKLLRKFSSDYAVGFIKHDAHSFEMDKEGKDTWKAMNSGAQEVFIHNDDKWARLGRGESNIFDTKINNLNLDFVLVEGHKSTTIPKLVVLGEGDCKLNIIDDFKQGKLENVLGFVGIEDNLPFCCNLPYFQRDRIDLISQFILNYFKKVIDKIPVYGLILAGGLSKRMGSDKGALNYHGRPQTHHCFEILSQLCRNTFISCRNEQQSLSHIKDLPQIHDSFPATGPLGGILSAMEQKPGAWLVVACDLPYLDLKNLKKLIRNRNPFKVATCFSNPEEGWAEPLCTLYEPKAYSRLLQFFSLRNMCPRKMLMNSSIKSITPIDQNIIINANTPEDYDQIIERIS